MGVATPHAPWVMARGSGMAQEPSRMALPLELGGRVEAAWSH